MKLPLKSGAYTARSLIANAQRCLNLFPEVNPEETDPYEQVTHYPKCGLEILANAPVGQMGAGRGLYTASNGVGYCAIGEWVYRITADWSLVQLGRIAPGTTPVSFADNGATNGNTIVLVDGTDTGGYTIDMTNDDYLPITDPTFVGSDFVYYIDGYFVFSQPRTNIVYISLFMSTEFDPLDAAAKIGYPDPISSFIVLHREIWLLGRQRGEIWYNSGAADFTFESLPGVFIQQGCCAKYSLAVMDRAVMWLSRDEKGQAMVMRNDGYAAKRISTHALEVELQKYKDVELAVGYTYQQQGHAFYALNFPSSNTTWVYDLTTQQWHERQYLDTQGRFQRDRVQLSSFMYNKNVGIDWQTGTLYNMSPDVLTDAGQPIVCIRSFPHVMDELKRVTHVNLILDMQVGTILGHNNEGQFFSPFSAGFSSGFGPITIIENPKVFLRWSDDRGQSWGTKVDQPLGSTGEFLTTVTYWRLGMARDRVYEVSWVNSFQGALQGAYLMPVGNAR